MRLFLLFAVFVVILNWFHCPSSLATALTPPLLVDTLVGVRPALSATSVARSVTLPAPAPRLVAEDTARSAEDSRRLGTLFSLLFGAHWLKLHVSEIATPAAVLAT